MIMNIVAIFLLILVILGEVGMALRIFYKDDEYRVPNCIAPSLYGILIIILAINTLLG